jgi:putative phosphoribosyl transferase
VFRNREEAAFRLAARLHGRPLCDLLVLAIPRGGVILGAVLAEELDADLDIVLTHTLPMPGNSELALGAVSEAGAVYLNKAGVALEPRLRGYLDYERQYQQREIVRRRQLYRGDRPAAPVQGRSVIITDDGVATGATMLAALQVLRRQLPLEIIVAVPVVARRGLEEVRECCDEVVCLLQPENLEAISPYYHEFDQVEDDQVVDLLSTFAVARRRCHERS